MALNLPKK